MRTYRPLAFKGVRLGEEVNFMVFLSFVDGFCLTETCAVLFRLCSHNITYRDLPREGRKRYSIP